MNQFKPKQILSYLVSFQKIISKSSMIKEIIDLISDYETFLSTPFLKTQVFANRVGNENIYAGVKRELNELGIEVLFQNIEFAKQILWTPSQVFIDIYISRKM